MHLLACDAFIGIRLKFLLLSQNVTILLRFFLLNEDSLGVS
ncbi:hypothetical protein MEC_01321 [Bartonella alsatica IBS 382]|uniref:Uncharacterized protein n=1 Tax=Bartonella alsatica IBS 382 TaxID=1094551 RepID=J0YIH3_9HYPH|nr:hypothetical protein MEC_01321 [Bartonella alsatica IBS 382]